MIKEHEPIDEYNKDLPVRTEEGIELDVMVDQPKREIDCFLCEERFNSAVDLDEHLLTKHQMLKMDREKLSAYWKWQSNEISKMKGKN